jgi:2-alkyl-3-oxoalkanoate reductase
MRVLVLGATGAIGPHLLPLLVSRGHEVVGATQSPAKIEQIRAMGAEGIVVDALDR